jgi:hypothetical protein
MQEQEWQSYVDQAFSRMDLDGDGFIDLDELLSELPAAYFSEPSSQDERIAEAKRMLREADENGDGRISKQVSVCQGLMRAVCVCDSLCVYGNTVARWAYGLLVEGVTLMLQVYVWGQRGCCARLMRTDTAASASR